MIIDMDISGWVDHLDELAVNVVDQMVGVAGWLQPPTVHILAEGLDPPYVGYMTCRPFYRGQDAATAISLLGLLPAALRASHLVVTWENEDLCTALQLPHDGSGFPNAVVVVDASRRGHTVRWHPVRLHVSPPGRAGLPTVTPEWGPAHHDQHAELPAPVAELLAVRRSPKPWSDGELVKLYASLESTGYEMRWIRREATGRQPSWVRLLA